MAKTTRCSTCQKENGIIFCAGCETYFCMKDFRYHREGLATEMDKIIQDRDRLQESVNETTRSSERWSPFIAQIDQWQKNMIQRIDDIANQTRRQVMELLEFKQSKLVKDVQSLSQQLMDLKESENFAEQDLTRLRELVQQYDQELKQNSQLPAIELRTEQSDAIEWNRLLYIEKLSEKNTERRRSQPQDAGGNQPSFAMTNRKKLDIWHSF